MKRNALHSSCSHSLQLAIIFATLHPQPIVSVKECALTKTSNLCLFSKSPTQDSTWVKVCVCAKTAKANSLPFTAAGNKPARPRALTFNDSPADAAEHEEQVLLQHHNGCFLSFFFWFSFFFSSRCFLAASLVRLPPCRWQAYPAGCALFFKKGSTRTPQICRDAPGAERSGAEAAL